MRVEKNRLENQILCSTKGELVVITLEGLLESLEKTKETCKEKKILDIENHIQKNILFLNELLNSLDFSIEISRELATIYFYCRKQLLKFTIKNDIKILDTVETMIQCLYQAFKMITQNDLKQKGILNLQGISGLTYGKKELEDVATHIYQSEYSV